MYITALEFALSFMFIVTILLLGILYGRFHWLLKSLLVVSSLVFCIFSYNAYVDILGYPANVEPTQVFRFYSGIVRDPNPSKNDKGAIYLWINEGKGRVEPRSIELPFSKETRETIAKAEGKIKNGEIVYMSFQSGNISGNNPNGTQNGGSGQLSQGSGTNKSPYSGGRLDFVPPPDTLPKKMD